MIYRNKDGSITLSSIEVEKTPGGRYVWISTSSIIRTSDTSYPTRKEALDNFIAKSCQCALGIDIEQAGNKQSTRKEDNE